jgi:hypothetical protein
MYWRRAEAKSLTKRDQIIIDFKRDIFIVLTNSAELDYRSA